MDDDESWSADRVSYLLNLLIRKPSLPILVPNPDLVFPYKNNDLYLTSGKLDQIDSRPMSCKKGIKLSITYLGKPYAPAYNYLQKVINDEHPNTPMKRIAMLGDSPATDILGANQHGWSSILIKTGNYLYGQGQKDCKPDWTFSDLKEFHQHFGVG